MGVVLFLFKINWAFGTYTSTYNKSMLHKHLQKCQNYFVLKRNNELNLIKKQTKNKGFQHSSSTQTFAFSHSSIFISSENNLNLAK